MKYDKFKEDLINAHAKTYADDYTEGRELAEALLIQYELLVIKRYYQSIARRTNEKKGFGTNRKLASEMGKRRKIQVRKEE